MLCTKFHLLWRITFWVIVPTRFCAHTHTHTDGQTDTQTLFRKLSKRIQGSLKRVFPVKSRHRIFFMKTILPPLYGGSKNSMYYERFWKIVKTVYNAGIKNILILLWYTKTKTINNLNWLLTNLYAKRK